MRDKTRIAKQVAIKAETGESVSAKAHVPPPYKESDFANTTGVVIVVVLVSIGIFIPPILLLNIPILIFRSFLKQLASLRKRIKFEPYACPKCGETNQASEAPGPFPLQFPCAHCRTFLTVDLAHD